VNSYGAGPVLGATELDVVLERHLLETLS
jgi:hypothetical protein